MREMRACISPLIARSRTKKKAPLILERPVEMDDAGMTSAQFDKDVFLGHCDSHLVFSDEMTLADDLDSVFLARTSVPCTHDGGVGALPKRGHKGKVLWRGSVVCGGILRARPSPRL